MMRMMMMMMMMTFSRRDAGAAGILVSAGIPRRLLRRGKVVQ